MQAQYHGRKLEVIKIDGDEALITYGGSDRTFLKTSELEFIGQPPPPPEPEVEPVERVEPETETEPETEPEPEPEPAKPAAQKKAKSKPDTPSNDD